ncbi:uncharacterized protein LOC128218403 [Mya arenaria]|uniref:uncharacterized protein LOC128218403 n=1 Tax=Mya arenaria TaxID=6604 RepID=UPI0022E0216B|nr:uncharacterized protein LOC128218403 [Mya arenaria]XP_052782030.1 uncharacterized protein LOC128218403 [Mya arenaria]
MDSLFENGCSDLQCWPAGPLDNKQINVAELTCARNYSRCYCSNVLTTPQYRWKFPLEIFELQKLQCEDGSAIKPGPQDDKLDSKSDNNADQERNTESDPQRLVYGSVTQADVEEFMEKDTPLERIKRTYDFWSHQHLNRTQQEYNLFKSSTTIILSLLGFNWYKGYLDAKTSFRKKYALVVFRSQGQAQKRRFNYLIHTTLGYGLRTTWKMSKFLLPLLIGQQMLEVYLNRTTPASFAISSGTVSCLSGFSLGPKGMFSRFVIGTGAGTLAGVAYTCIARFSRQTQEELEFYNVARYLQIQKNFAEGRPLDYMPEDIADVYREQTDDFD